MYQEWKQREEKIANKRKEMQQEEDKLKKLAYSSLPLANQRMPPQSVRNQSPYASQQSLANTNNSRINQLYSNGKKKSKKQEALREKVYREQGYTFKPAINQGVPLSAEGHERISKDVV